MAKERMKLTTGVANGAVVLRIHARSLCDPRSTLDLRHALDRLAQATPDVRVVLDMREVEALDSRFLNILFHRRARPGEPNPLALAGLSDTCAASFRAVGLAKNFGSFRDVDEAAQSLGKPKSSPSTDSSSMFGAISDCPADGPPDRLSRCTQPPSGGCDAAMDGLDPSESDSEIQERLALEEFFNPPRPK